MKKLERSKIDSMSRSVVDEGIGVNVRRQSTVAESAVARSHPLSRAIGVEAQIRVVDEAVEVLILSGVVVDEAPVPSRISVVVVDEARVLIRMTVVVEAEAEAQTRRAVVARSLVLIIVGEEAPLGVGMIEMAVGEGTARILALAPAVARVITLMMTAIRCMLEDKFELDKGGKLIYF
jgi:hypothetical protein